MAISYKRILTVLVQRVLVFWNTVWIFQFTPDICYVIINIRIADKLNAVWLLTDGLHCAQKLALRIETCTCQQTSQVLHASIYCHIYRIVCSRMNRCLSSELVFQFMQEENALAYVHNKYHEPSQTSENAVKNKRACSILCSGYWNISSDGCKKRNKGISLSGCDVRKWIGPLFKNSRTPNKL
jgi:hypothetical protein